MKIKKITKIAPEPSRCIEVSGSKRVFAAGGEDGASIISHNSVVQRNIILGCILRPDSWKFLGIDLKKVELSAFRAYSNVVLGIATELEDALTVLRFANQTMMKRYSEMEQLGVNNFLDLPEKGQALMVMVDEAGELLSPSGVKALSEKTVIPLANGTFTTMKDLQIGDTILDNYENPTTVINKYQPEEQTQYKLNIRKDSNGASEEFIAGREHWWVAIIESPDGSKSPQQLMTTEDLHNFKKEQDKLPVSERSTIKFKKYKKS